MVTVAALFGYIRTFVINSLTEESRNSVKLLDSCIKIVFPLAPEIVRNKMTNEVIGLGWPIGP